MPLTECIYRSLPGAEKRAALSLHKLFGRIATGLGLLAVAGLVHANSIPSCGTGFVLPDRPEVQGKIDTGEVEISAAEASLSEAGESLLKGDVQLRRGALQLSTNELTYNADTEIAKATGALKLWDRGVFITGRDGHIDLGAETTSIGGVRYLLSDTRAHGQADKMTLRTGEVLLVEHASYSTCDPDDSTWMLQATSIELDRVNDVGAAYNVWVEFESVPIFYSPYLTFPLSDKRKSGLLTPRARVSSSTGIEYTQPYYFNLAPNRDATVAARVMSDRGVQARGEYRYLESWGEGTLAAELLPDDRRYDSSRAAVSFLHNGYFDEAKRWHTTVNFGWVSDDDYLEDLGTNLALASRLYLERQATLRYNASGWWARARVQDYQTLDDTIDSSGRPYERLPQFLISTALPEHNRRINFSGVAEVVHFDRSTGVTGSRVDLRPTISFPVRGAGAYVTPRASMRLTQYSLDGQTAGLDDSPSRFTPSLSVDSGLTLEKGLNIGGRSFTHTLEPRLNYLLVPYDGQDDIPVFDTGRSTFNYAQLFREDRFNGADRVGDANQVSVALTTRLLTPGGQESLQASIGQIRYLRDRRVTLPGRPRETRDASDIIAQFGVNLDRKWRVLGGMHWDPDEERTDKQVVSLRYQPEPHKVLNLAYRFLREESFSDQPSVEQADFSFGWSVNHNLSWVGRWNYALDERTTLESFAGLEYESCCWAARAIVRRYLTNEDGKHDNGVFLQLELKGLAGVGSDTLDFIERHVPGYQNRF